MSDVTEHSPISALRLAVGEDAARVVMVSLRDAGFVCAPVRPTSKMVDDAWASAGAEDAAGVWRDMIESWERSLNSR